jgi:hypothetical protein
VLAAHGYDSQGKKFRHPNRQSGSYGADIKVFGGVEQVFSHNATDPLHRDNLPAWCGGDTALDTMDAATIRDFAVTALVLFANWRNDSASARPTCAGHWQNSFSPWSAGRLLRSDQALRPPRVCAWGCHAEVIDVASWCAADP